MKKVNLFCLPYGGGSAISYRIFRNYLEDFIDLCPVELAGRGERFTEPLYKNIPQAVDDVYERIKSSLDNVPYAIFGHSMGSIISYELYFKIIAMSHTPPVHLFVSGRDAPDIKKDEVLHNLPDDEFATKVMQYEGTPKEVFENKELADIVIPILRSDFKLVETYTYKHENKKLNTDMTVMYGADDVHANHKTNTWKHHVNGFCKTILFEGGHFFIFNDPPNVAAVFNKTLQRCLG